MVSVVIIIVVVALKSLNLIVVSFIFIISLLGEAGVVGHYGDSDRSGFLSFKKDFVFS